MKIIVDVMGSDKGVEEIVKGSIDAVNEFDVEIILVGIEDEIQKALDIFTYDKTKLSIEHASEVISNEDEPVRAIRRKKDSSMVVAARLLKEGRADGMLSTGSTGALLASGLFIVGRIQGIDRGAISIMYPTFNGHSLLLDTGANVDSKAEYLYQFAQMGKIYMEEIIGKENPKIGLINIGVEEGKGNKLVQETYGILKDSKLNFIGNIEARDLLKGEADILICDGFVGNIVLKVTEGTAMGIVSMLKEKFTKNIKTKLAAGMMMPELKELKAFMDYREVGGAPILGINKPLFKAHGSSDSYAVKNAIKQLIDFINKDIINSIEKEIKEIED